MSLKTLVVASLFAALPFVATAQCMGDQVKADQQAMSCLPGTAWDAQAAVCVPTATS